VHRIFGFNEHATVSRRTRTLDFDLFFRDGKLQLLGSLEHCITNHVIAFDAVGAETCFVFEAVLELVISKIGWNYLRAT